MNPRLRSFFSVRPFTIATSLTILVLVLFIVGIPILDLVELKTYDLRFLSRGKKIPDPSVVLAVIDEKSLDTEGRWPWPRSKIARLIEVLSNDGAKVITFDIGFLEPDENSNLAFVAKMGEQVNQLGITDHRLKQFIEESKLSADNDLILTSAIKNAKASVILGHFFHVSRKGLGYEINENEIQAQLKRVEKSRYPLVKFEEKDSTIDPFITAYAPEGNLDTLSGAARGTGYFNMFPDRDGVVRWMPLVIKCGQDLYTPLSIQSVWHFMDRPQLMVKVAGYGIRGVQMGDSFVPTDETGQVLVNYLGPGKTFPHYSIGDILGNRTPKGAFAGKIVLIGATAIGIYDLRNTPFEPVYPGIEIHASVIDNVLRQDFLYKPRWTTIFDVFAILFLGFLVGLVTPRLGALKGMFFALVLFSLHILMTQLLFSHYRLWVNMIYPLLTLVLVYTVLTVYHYVKEEREKKKIKGAFVQYVSGSVVNDMLKYPEKLKLGGDKKDLSVLFSDIRGFTTISEGLAPEDLVHLLNEYLTAMTDVVFKYDGTLDKYMGDAVMAIYGAPLDQPDHPVRACNSALDMMEDLKKLNEKWMREGKKPMDIGIGINTGPMMVGNMGSKQRFDYTVMGDMVNLGSRLEGANKNYQTNIIISEFTYERVKDNFVCMELDSVRVKGKTLPVKIYQLIGRNNIDPSRKEAIKYFRAGLQLYKQQRWDKAIEAFQTATAMDKTLHPARLYIERSQDLKADPPGGDWDGVFTMKTK